MRDEEDDDVGYKRPPKRHQFKKGQSGNPRGRPKGVSLKATFDKVANKRVWMTVDGKRQSVTQFQFILMKQFQVASQGNMTAARDLQNLALKLDTIDREAEQDPRQMQMPQLLLVGVRPKPRPDDERLSYFAPSNSTSPIDS